VPGLHACYLIPTPPNAANHTPGFTAAARTEEAHRLTLDTGKGMAAAGWRVLAEAEFASEVKKGWEEDVAFATR
jgi:hypothetical protein